jgi:hypothetical protein
MLEPVIGEMRKAKDAGYPGWGRYLWHACERCGTPRWVQYNQTLYGRHKVCKPCSNILRSEKQRGEASYNWRGGKHVDSHGYLHVMVDRKDSMRKMANKSGYVLEHRIVMAKHLGRCLEPSEIIHHKNGIKNDNRIENLELTSLGNHALEHSKGYESGFRKGLADGRLKQIQKLRKQVAVLEAELEELRQPKLFDVERSVIASDLTCCTTEVRRA